MTSTKFCNNKVPSKLQYNVLSSFRTHLTEENSKSTSPFLLLMVLKNYFHMNMKLLFPKYFFCLKFVLPKYQMTGAFNILFHWYDPKFEILPLEVSRGALLVFNYFNRLLFLVRLCLDHLFRPPRTQYSKKCKNLRRL